MTEGWGPFSRVQEHPWSIHYRNPRIEDPELYDVARLSSAYGRSVPFRYQHCLKANSEPSSAT